MERGRIVVRRFEALVIGDVMLDTYYLTEVRRHSPEEKTAEVYDVQSTYHRLGGAANVANNLISMGWGVTLVGLVGEDDSRREIERMIEERGIESYLSILPSHTTTQKIRVYRDGVYQFRIDREDRSPELWPQWGIVADISALSSVSYDAVVISDYAKGVIQPQTVRGIRRLFSGVPIFCAPKPVNFPILREEADWFLFNQTEADAVLSSGIAFGLQAAGYVTTLGDGGAEMVNIVYTEDYWPVLSSLTVDSGEVDAVDVTGAGDTFLAAFINKYVECPAASSIENDRYLLSYANHMAASAVRQLGTAVPEEEAEEAWASSQCLMTI